MEQTREKNRVSAVNIVFLITMVISVAVGFLPLDFMVGRPALQILFSQVIFIIPAAVYMIKEKMSYRQTVQLRKMKVEDILLTLLFGFLLQPVLTFINALSMVFSTNTTSTFLLDISEQVPFLAGVFLIAVVPAILEESVYRGFFFTEYKKHHLGKAVLLSGVLFGLMHGNINQFCYATVMGCIFALLIEATGSILSTMLIHFCTNAFSVVTIYLYPSLFEICKGFYRMYLDMGETELAEVFAAAFGDMTLTGNEWVRQMMENPVKLTLIDVILMYLPSAVAMGTLAFLVFRKLAQRNGNWERIRSCIGKKSETMEEKEYTEPIVTIPMMIAMAIGVLFMFAYEMLLRLPR